MPLRTHFLPLAAAILLALLPGCAARWPADPMRSGFAVEFNGDAAVQWPDRDRGWGARELVGDGQERRLWFTGLSVRKDGVRTVFQAINVRVLRVTPRGQGLVAQIEPVDPKKSAEGWTPTARYLFYSSGVARFPVELLADPTAGRNLRRVRSRPTSPVTFRLLEPEGRPARGVAIALSSFGDPRYEAKVVDALLDRGWAVLVTSFPVGTLFMMGPPQEDRASPERFGVWAASRVDNRLAEWAFACEAVLEDLAHVRPDIPQDKLSLVGFSAGAIGLPAVAMRLGERVDAAVLVGGGADILRIVHTSVLFAMVDELRWGSDSEAPASRETINALSAAYLSASRMDPYHAAASLRSTPVLMLHASWDRIVPADAGDALYHRLGRPDRWTFPLGHELMFWRLPAYAGDIARWIEAACERTE